MPEITIKHDANERVIGLGTDVAEAARQRALAEAAASEADTSAAFAEEFSGPAYTDVAAGEAATTEGQFFRVPNGTTPETYTRYQRTSVGSVEAASLATTDDLASTASGQGAALVGWIKNAVGAVAGSVADMFEDDWSVMQFIPLNERVKIRLRTSTADVAPYIQAAVDALIAAGGGTLKFPNGTYPIQTTIGVDRPASGGTPEGNIGVIFQGCGRGTIINQTGAGKDLLEWSQTNVLFNSGIRDMQLICETTAGHVIKVGAGFSTNFFHNVEMMQKNPNKSIWYAPNGKIFDSEFAGGTWWLSPASTVPGFDIDCNDTTFNENVFRNLRCYYATGAQWFDIHTVGSGQIWLNNNRWENINFEICRGGGFNVDSLRNCNFKNIGFWDSQGLYTGDLIVMGSGSGLESTANVFENVARNGDDVAAGVKDIRITAGTDTILINCYTQSGDDPYYDFGNKRATIFGRFISANLTGAANTRKFGTGDGVIQFPGTVNGTYLNYYDEGSWTGALTGTVAAPTTPVTATGQWTRIGRKVRASVQFTNVDTSGTAGNVTVLGLPFTVNATHAPAAIAHMVGLGSIVGVAKAAGTNITLYRATSGTAITHADGTAGTGKSLHIDIEYIV